MTRTTLKNCSFLLGDLHPHAFLGPPKSSSKTASQSVQPFLHIPPQSDPLLYNGQLRFPVSPKLPLRLGGSDPPSNIWYLRPTRVINRNGISIGSAVFVWVPNAMLYNALSTGENPLNCPLPLGFRYPTGERPSHGHRQHKKLGKDRTCGAGDISRTDRQTNTQTYSSHYFTTALASKVKITLH